MNNINSAIVLFFIIVFKSLSTDIYYQNGLVINTELKGCNLDYYCFEIKGKDTLHVNTLHVDTVYDAVYWMHEQMAFHFVSEIDNVTIYSIIINNKYYEMTWPEIITSFEMLKPVQDIKLSIEDILQGDELNNYISNQSLIEK